MHQAWVMYHDPGWDGMLLQGYIDSKNMGTCFDTYLYGTYKKNRRLKKLIIDVQVLRNRPSPINQPISRDRFALEVVATIKKMVAPFG